MAKRSKYRIEHVAAKPRGGRVITKTSGQHLVRVWYPNPRERAGAGARVLQILHPRREHNSACIFTDGLGERIRRNPEELVILGLNPHRSAHGNPAGEQAGAADLYRRFHGREPREVLELQRSAVMREDYAALGDLEYIVFLPEGERSGRRVDFTREDAVKLAANADGTQLYLIGGCQDLSGCLDDFPVDLEKDLIDLGEVARVSYFTRKAFDGFRPVFYYHDLGEEGGARPRGMYDKLKREIFFVGGDYKIQPEGIVN